MVLIGGVEERAGVHCLKMAAAMFTEVFDNSQRSMRLIPESQSYILNSSHKNLRIKCVPCLNYLVLTVKCGLL